MKVLFFLAIFIVTSTNAQNTLSVKEGDLSPAAYLSQFSWMEGYWKGEAFGGITEEIWSPPLGGTMMFSFKLVAEGKVQFYELGHIRQLDKTLVFELIHFHSDLKAWEVKDEVQSFKLIEVAENRHYFDGFTFEKISADKINIYGLIHQDNDEVEVVLVFNYKRA